jgi:hypothetical protein
MFRAKLMGATALCGALSLPFAGSPAVAADLTDYTPPPPLAQLPAVDGVNGKVSATGGGFNNGGLGLINGSVSIPLAPSFGTQFDAAVGDFAGLGYASIANHTFWRNPATGLLGFYGDYMRLSGDGGADIGHIAGEGEAYFSRITLRGVAGVEFGHSGTFNFGLDRLNVRTRFFDKADLAYFVDDDTSVFVGHRYTAGINAAAVGAEHLFHLGDGTAVSAFAEGRLGENNYRAAWGGIRLYFGDADKSLIRRSRENDPSEWTSDTALALIQNKIHHAASPPPSPPPPSPPPPPPPPPPPGPPRAGPSAGAGGVAVTSAGGAGGIASNGVITGIPLQ